MESIKIKVRYSVADPGFPVRGARTRWGGGHRPPMRALFSENVCDNERIESRRGGGRAPDTPRRSANGISLKGNEYQMNIFSSKIAKNSCCFCFVFPSDMYLF